MANLQSGRGPHAKTTPPRLHRDTRRILRRFYRPWWKRPFSWLLVAVLPALFIGRIALTPWVEDRLRTELQTRVGDNVTFEDADIHLLSKVLVFNDVRVSDPGNGAHLAMDRVEIHPESWRGFFADNPRVRVRLVRPHLAIEPALRQQAASLWHQLPPAEIEALVIQDGIASVDRADGHGPRQIWDEISMRVAQLRSGPGAPPTLANCEVDARFLRTGRMHVSFHPTEKGWSARLGMRRMGLGSTAGEWFEVGATAQGHAAEVTGQVTVVWPIDAPPEKGARAVVRELDALQASLGAPVLGRVASIDAGGVTSANRGVKDFQIHGHMAAETPSAVTTPFRLLVDVAHLAATSVPPTESLAKDQSLSF